MPVQDHSAPEKAHIAYAIPSMILSPNCVLTTVAALGSSGPFPNRGNESIEHYVHTKLQMPNFAALAISTSGICKGYSCYARNRSAALDFGRAGTVLASLAITYQAINDKKNKNPGFLSFLGIKPDKYMYSQSFTKDSVAEVFEKGTPRPRIAIVGGGLAGVTAARSINQLLQKDYDKRVDIVIYEGDPNVGKNEEANYDIQRKIQPVWSAAVAKNANSMVPGAAMHIMSQRNTLIEIATDTVNEWFLLHLENVKHCVLDNLMAVRNIDNFNITPPYFALHLFKCLGPSASWDERRSFVTFMKHFAKRRLQVSLTRILNNIFRIKMT